MEAILTPTIVAHFSKDYVANCEMCTKVNSLENGLS